MDLPATFKRDSVVLVMLNGITLPTDEVELRERFIRFEVKVQRRDHIRVLILSSDSPLSFEWEIPYDYEAGQWFDPSNPHDPSVKQLPEPPLRVTQL